DGEIVVADSRKVYRGLDIGTAKPGRRARERVPHHMLDLVNPGEPYDAAAYAEDARIAVASVQARGRTAIVSGGTGLYLAALAGGLDPIAPGVDASDREKARGKVREIPPERRHEALAAVDPGSADRLHPRDRQRVDRALEVWHLTGTPLSEHHRGGAERLDHVAFRIERPRSELHDRIQRRLERMLDAGLEEEARGLWREGWSPTDPGLDTIGYQEWWPFFEGEIGRREAVHRILAASRRYAKRQSTWFRHQGDYRPVDAAGAVEAIASAWTDARGEGG
ncbi:MAG: tRNA (adenosine(37)-N6)-dimethylallyltransferase MiaA, partial [Gemmatimonadota bacterium]|nr:tRNA (adenosine(37)-N6)-dimethylallyltransferase MiaA [Gemmatimonadota bacterium]